MRHSFIILLGVILACSGGAQARRQLLGKLVKGDDPSQVPVHNAKIVLDESGSHDVTNSDGLFHLFLPDVLRSGDEVSITVTLPGYAVIEPPGGRLRIPADLARTRVTIQLLPKGSPKFLSDAQLRNLIESAARASSRPFVQFGAKRIHSDAKGIPDLEDYLENWGEQHGINPDQVRKEVEHWAAKVTADETDPYELGLAAFATRNFQKAYSGALDAAQKEEEALDAFQKQETESITRLIRDYRLAGDAAYNNLDFEQASIAYGKALARVSRDRSRTQWAELQRLVGNSEESLVPRCEGEAIKRHADSAKRAYESASVVFTREKLPEEWATTQNGMAVLHLVLGERSEKAQAVAYLEQALAEFDDVLEVRTREQLPQEWAKTQNDLSIALIALGRWGGVQTSTYLERALAAIRGALEVTSREQLPQQWALTQINLGVALDALSEWKRKALAPPDQEEQMFVLTVTSTTQNPERAIAMPGVPPAPTNLSISIDGAIPLDSQDAALARSYLEQSMLAFQNALQVFTREQQPYYWATTQLDLGFVLDEIGISGGTEAEIRTYLEQSIEAFRNALQVFTRTHQPQDWAAAQLSLGHVFLAFAPWSERETTGAYLEQSIEVIRNALEVYTEDVFPYQWLQAMKMLAIDYEVQKDLTKALETYQALLNYDPGNATWQAKVKELQQKR